MRTKIVLIAYLLIAGIATGFASDKIKGNGKIESRAIQVDEYEQLFLGERIEYNGNAGMNFFKKKNKRFPIFTYSQTMGSATLEITMDENLFEYLDIKQENKALRIQAQKDYLLNPTLLQIKGSSGGITKVEIIGCMDFLIESVLNVENIRASIGGVGNITIHQLNSEEITCNLSGVGNFYLGGRSEKGNYYLSGVGNFDAYNCNVEELVSEISGVGNMKVRASEKLKAGTSGVGNIKYRGNADVDSWASGLGKVKNNN